jgi:membrane fusion protein (multidrug efflux system)
MQMLKCSAASVVALFSLALVACGAGEGGAAPGARPAASTALPVQVYSAQRRDLSRVVRVSAVIESLSRVRLAAQAPGVLEQMRVEEGDRVTRGQVLATLDVRESRAELARARATLGEQQAVLERLERLKERNYIDQASYTLAETQRAVAAADVQLWETRVDHGTVRSTLDGVVIERYAEPGEAVAQYAPLFTLADMTRLVVRFGLSELDVEGLTVGVEVPVRVDALRGDDVMMGTLRRVMPSTEGASRLVTVEVLLPENAHERVRLGYLARAELAVDRRPDVLAVPVGAVAVDGDGSYVMAVSADNTLIRRNVTAGVARGNWREIVAGLEEGEDVVTANPADFSEGEAVRVVSRMDGGA